MAIGVANVERVYNHYTRTRKGRTTDGFLRRWDITVTMLDGSLEVSVANH